MKRLSIALVPLLLLAACGSDDTTPRASGEPSSTTTSTTAPGPSVLAQHCDHLEQRPTLIVITCADANIQVTEAQWSSWIADGAEGTATMLVNPCDPYCAADDMEPFPASVHLGKPVDGVFSELVVTWTDRSPTGHPTDTYELATAPLSG